MQDILAFVPNYAGQWSRSMRYAAELAALCDAGLTGIFVSEPIAPMASPLGVPIAFPEIYSWAADLAREARATEPAFLRWASASGVKHPLWQVAEGHLTAELEHAGNSHDLLVLGAGTDSLQGSVGVLGRILLTCGLPCLVVPESLERAAALNRIAIAWNGSVESVRAVHAALPLLKRARQVELIYGERAQPSTLVEWKRPLDIEAYLERHMIACSKWSFNTSHNNDGAELLRMAIEQIDADLLVVGAYGHSRFSEWMLGGATRHVLENSPVPLFMCH